MPINHCQMAIKKRIMTAKVIGYMKPDIDPNTRLYVPFNEGVGDLAKDYSQYCNHAALTDVEWSPDGFNGAGKFNGSSSYGDCGNDASLDVADALSIEVRAKTTQTTRGQIVCKQSSFMFTKRATINKMGIFLYGTTVQEWKLGNTVVNDGALHHIVATYDGDGGTSNGNFYLDGEPDGHFTSTGYITIDSYVVGIGAQAFIAAPAEFFNGTIDNVLIFSIARNTAQIAADCYEVVCN